MMCGRGRGREVVGTDVGSASCVLVADIASKMMERLPRLFDLKKVRLDSSKVRIIYPAILWPALPCRALSYPT